MLDEALNHFEFAQEKVVAPLSKHATKVLHKASCTIQRVFRNQFTYSLIAKALKCVPCSRLLGLSVLSLSVFVVMVLQLGQVPECLRVDPLEVVCAKSMIHVDIHVQTHH